MLVAALAALTAARPAPRPRSAISSTPASEPPRARLTSGLVAPTKPGSFDLQPQYVQHFSHRGEVARPGDYRVSLGDGTRSELSATTRIGVLHLAFPAGSHPSVLVNPAGSEVGDFSSEAAVDPAAHEITGTVTGGTFCEYRDRYTLHYVVGFDRAFAASGTWSGQHLIPGSRSASDQGWSPRVPWSPAVSLDPRWPRLASRRSHHRCAGRRLRQLRRGRTDPGAHRALHGVRGRGPAQPGRRGAPQTELREPEDVGAPPLGASAGEGGRGRRKRSGIGACSIPRSTTPRLCRTSSATSTGATWEWMARFNVPAGHAQYANFSGWDIYRTQIPLLALIDRSVASDVVSSFVRDAQQSGGLPKWSLLTGHTIDPARVWEQRPRRWSTRG